jgi:TolB-like protein/Flp pilus assembly protein TadD
LIGRRLGPYEITSAIGAGGMGEVYRARDTRLGRDVALKILPEAMASDPERLARFEREARTVAALNHPHIVTLFSTEEAEGVRFLTMELVEGRPLDQLIPPGGVSLARFFDVAIALADALAAAHQKQITHRDLKPANVMVADDGRVKVLDFGLSRPADGVERTAAEEATLQKLTVAGTILGTMPYMSPEQVEARPLDGRSDIFSLGVVMYEMATGTRPFEGASSPALLSSILKDHPPPANEKRRELPEGVAGIVARCLEKAPRDRVQSAHEVLVELRAEKRVWESGAGERCSAAGNTAPGSDVRRRALRIAVLPFVARPATADTEVLADGLTDDTTAGLARFPYLQVAPRADAAELKGQGADARAAATLGARYLLDGTLRTSGSLTRLTVRLVDTESGAHLWTESYDRSLVPESVFELQDDLTSRIVSTVADAGGVLVRSMAAGLKERPVETLSVDELVVRFLAYLQSFRPEEHARLRAAFEAGLGHERGHALGWACLADLYEHEHEQGFNPLPDAAPRAAQAAARSVEIDPSCQAGWLAIAQRHFHERDASSLRLAAERVIALNPLNATLLAEIGMMLTYAGDGEQGVTLVRRAMELNPQHPGWCYYPIAVDHYRKGELEEALTCAKRSVMSRFVWTPVLIAAAAGPLGRAADARAAFDTLRRHHAETIDPDRLRSLVSEWIWDEGLLEQVLDGFAKARALAEAGASPVSSALSRRPPSSPEAGPPPSGSGPVGTRTPSGPMASIAILPFADLSAEKDQEWLCDGIAEEILTALSQVRGLSVAARASAFSFRGRADDLRAIGDKLHVSTVLDGSVRRAGDRLRVTVRLSDVANGLQIWSDRYDREMKDVLEVQDEIAKAIASRLRVGVAEGEAPRVVRHTTNQEAYHLYLRARHLWYARSKGSLQRARQLFEEATRRDPAYPLPWVGLCDLYTILCLYGFEREDVGHPKARAAVERALALNDQVAEAHRALGFCHLFLDWTMKSAVSAFERSVELDPTSGLTHVWLGWPAWPGRDDVALTAARRAQQLDPLNAYIHSLVGAVHDFYGRGEEGLPAVEQALEIDPNYLVGLYLGGGVYSRLGRHDDALPLFARAVELTERAPFYVSYEAWAQAHAGNVEAARSALAELQARATSEHVQPLHLAVVHAALGERDRAFALLQDAVRARNGWIGTPRMPMFDDFRGDPRFAALLAGIDHPDTEASRPR